MSEQTLPHGYLLRPGESYATILRQKFHKEVSPAGESPPPLPDPDTTGTLDATEQATLWFLISYIGVKWGIQASSDLTEDTFQWYLSLKTTKTPSYYTAYRTAISIYEALLAQHHDQAPDLFYTPDGGASLPGWDVVRQWVIKEFITIYVKRGAFRAYGWHNYLGYGGGPYNNPDDLPYRPCVTPSENGGKDG